jgi:ABC-type iron transport system FetAB ATPase subunit
MGETMTSEANDRAVAQRLTKLETECQLLRAQIDCQNESVNSNTAEALQLRQLVSGTEQVIRQFVGGLSDQVKMLLKERAERIERARARHLSDRVQAGAKALEKGSGSDVKQS